ncbi:MAG: hypothetical protein WD749_03260 [Phycisphaerales bacterium]
MLRDRLLTRDLWWVIAASALVPWIVMALVAVTIRWPGYGYGPLLVFLATPVLCTTGAAAFGAWTAIRRRNRDLAAFSPLVTATCACVAAGPVSAVSTVAAMMVLGLSL